MYYYKHVLKSFDLIQTKIQGCYVENGFNSSSDMSMGSPVHVLAHSVMSSLAYLPLIGPVEINSTLISFINLINFKLRRYTMKTTLNTTKSLANDGDRESYL